MAPSDYASVALARAKELPNRLGIAAFIGAAAAVFTHSWIPAAWLAAVVVVQLIDHAASRPIRKHPEAEPTAKVKAIYIASITGSAIVFSSIAVFCWFAGATAGKVFAILLPAGTVLAMSIRIGLSRQLLAAGWVPHAIYLIGLPIASGLLTPAADLLEMSVLSLAGILFLAHVLSVVRRMADSAANLQKANEESDAQRVAAVRANAAKSEFLATISHEIRTPMNAVVAAADLLRRTPLDADQAEQVSMMANASEVLMGLLNDVLDLSKIESGKVVIESAPFSLVEKLELGARLWRPRAAEKGVDLHFEPTGLPHRVQTDPLRLQQILFNLLSNAVKFTDTGRIVVRGGRDAAMGRLWFEVMDTGCGMDDATAARVFESFEQATAATAREHGGTGLGLAISRRLAELMGGSLTVDSRAGEGSTFRLEIPLVEMNVAEAPSVQGSLGHGDAGGVHILVAEDHAVNQRIVRLILEPLGIRLTVVDNGAEAVQAAATQPFDAILMDMQMPVMDGLEATRRILASPGPNRCTPVVALTANALAEHRAQWAEVGVTHFVAKPVNMQSLVDVVMQTTAARREVERAREADGCVAEAHIVPMVALQGLSAGRR